MDEIIKQLSAHSIRIIEQIDNNTLSAEDASYLFSYKHFLTYFENKPKKLTVEDLVIGIHFVYGWMPTIFHFKSLDTAKLTEAIGIINKYKGSDVIESDEPEQLEKLKEILNNSIVGTSKLLHFINPDKYAIWDSRVHSYIRKNFSESGIGYEPNNVKNYIKYLNFINEIKSHPNFKSDVYKPLKDVIKEKYKYKISQLRAIEMILFYAEKEVIEKK
jgi:hypothetical protein